MARETANNGTSATSLDSAGGAATATKNNKKPSGKSAKSAMITNAAEAITLGITAIEQGDRDGANKIFNDTVTLDPNNAEAWVWLAGTSSDLDDAEAAFEKAYALDPNNEQASLGLRWVRLRRKVALNEMVEAVVAAPGSATSGWNDGTAYAPLAVDMGQIITVKCNNCGKENALSEKFCLDCGQDLRGPSTAITPTPNYIKPEPVKDGPPRYLIAVGIAVMVLVFILVAAWYMTQPH